MPFANWNDNESRELLSGFHGRFIHTDRLTVANWTIKAGAELPAHDHPHEQLSLVTEGRFEMTIDGETQILEPGMVAIIPGGTPHSGHALTDCRIIDIFQPARDDYR